MYNLHKTYQSYPKADIKRCSETCNQNFETLLHFSGFFHFHFCPLRLLDLFCKHRKIACKEICKEK